LCARGESVYALSSQRIMIAGAGSAGIGVVQVLMQATMEQGASEEEANPRSLLRINLDCWAWREWTNCRKNKPCLHAVREVA
jgi:hypothetical protein